MECVKTADALQKIPVNTVAVNQAALNTVLHQNGTSFFQNDEIPNPSEKAFDDDIACSQ
jgi:hypothetical protein